MKDKDGKRIKAGSHVLFDDLGNGDYHRAEVIALWKDKQGRDIAIMNVFRVIGVDEQSFGYSHELKRNNWRIVKYSVC